MSSHSESTSSKAPQLGGFLLLAIVLWGFGDLLTAIVGTVLIGAAFAAYNSPRHF
ncbi:MULTISPECIES: hypothetical protein [Siphonobacter]|uniref:hypothetical protein n=1 Tax=Siphonobacter TaxID=700450 RepID=UPI0013FD6390|nr:hypothetical protein [Siphonobacter curvatus]